MRLCRFYRKKYSPRKEFGHLGEVKEVEMYANGKDTLLKNEKKEEKGEEQSQHRDC